MRSVPDKGVGYGLLRYLAGSEAGAQLAALATPRITFNYLGQFDRQFDDQALFVRRPKAPVRRRMNRRRWPTG